MKGDGEIKLSYPEAKCEVLRREEDGKSVGSTRGRGEQQEKEINLNKYNYAYP